ncbi:MAG: hypothetical protein Q4B43_05455 [Bacteroidota bacterium]|nr:hypothetical protein [Bacteroidota bacterium]
MAERKAKKETGEDRFTKEQILKSKRFSDRKDLLNISLENNKTYTIEEVSKIVKEFMNKDFKDKEAK